MPGTVIFIILLVAITVWINRKISPDLAGQGMNSTGVDSTDGMAHFQAIQDDEAQSAEWDDDDDAFQQCECEHHTH